MTPEQEDTMVRAYELLARSLKRLADVTEARAAIEPPAPTALELEVEALELSNRKEDARIAALSKSLDEQEVEIRRKRILVEKADLIQRKKSLISQGALRPDGEPEDEAQAIAEAVEEKNYMDIERQYARKMRRKRILEANRREAEKQ